MNTHLEINFKKLEKIPDNYKTVENSSRYNSK